MPVAAALASEPEEIDAWPSSTTLTSSSPVTAVALDVTVPALMMTSSPLELSTMISSNTLLFEGEPGIGAWEVLLDLRSLRICAPSSPSMPCDSAVALIRPSNVPEEPVCPSTEALTCTPSALASAVEISSPFSPTVMASLPPPP